MSKKDSLVQAYYELHHVGRRRLRQSVLEKERGRIFSRWIGKGNTVLDLGGRDGNLTKYFLEGNEVTIADIDENALRYAHENYCVETRWVNLNEELPFESEKFDVVVMAEVLEHLPYPRITLSEILRVLNKDGKFICNFPLAYHLKDRLRVVRGKKLSISRDPTHLQFLSYSDAKELLSGFFEIKEELILKGGWLGDFMPTMFAKNVAFNCMKRIEE